MRILCTGAQGQVGQAIKHAVKDFSHIQLIPLDRTVCDITNLALVRRNIIRHQPNVIINCAGFTQVDKAESLDERQKVYDVNAKGPENLAKICREQEVLLLHLSTDYVFDGSKNSPYTEEDETHPISEYGKSKLAGEEAIRQYAQRYIILRVSWVFSEFCNNPLKNMLKLMQTRDVLNIVDDQIACPTYAGDIAQVLLLLSQYHKNHLKNGIYHYSNTPAITRYALAKTIYLQGKQIDRLHFRELDLHPIATSELLTPARRPKNSVLDCSLFVKTFGVSLKPWHHSLKHCLENIT